MDGFMIVMPYRGQLYLHRVGAVLVVLPGGDRLVKTLQGAYLWVRP